MAAFSSACYQLYAHLRAAIDCAAVIIALAIWPTCRMISILSSDLIIRIAPRTDEILDSGRWRHRSIQRLWMSAVALLISFIF